MPDVGQFDVAGVRPEKPSKFNSLATLKQIGGLQTQRSPFMSIATRYDSRYLGGKPDSLIAGSNVEISNKLLLQRRPGLLPYGTVSIPPADFFFSWQQSTLANFVATVDPNLNTYPSGNLQLIIDTSVNANGSTPGNIYNYSPTYAGIILNKSALSQQTSFATVINTMYMGDGVDLYKMTGANLLTQSNSFGTSPWSTNDTTLTTGQLDPTGATNASYAVFSLSSTAAYITQTVTPNYMPVSNNTFTFSVWMKSNSGAPTIFLEMMDSTGAVMVNTQQTLSTHWQLYQVTGTAANGATSVQVFIIDPSSTFAHYFLYGAQLEAGGPATPTVITTNKPLGVWLWGIQAPITAPTFTTATTTGSTGQAWQPNHAYSQTSLVLTSVGATSNSVAVYHGTITSGGSNAYAGRYVSIVGFTNTSNNSVAPGFLCTASTATTLTLSNLAAVAETHAGTATLLDTIVDSNGNLEVAYTPGTSGSSQPVWNPVAGNTTADGLQGIIIQSTSQQILASSGSIAFLSNVTAGNTLLVFFFGIGSSSSLTITDSQSNSYSTTVSRTGSRNLEMFIKHTLSAASSASCTVSWSGSDSVGWIAIAEISHQTSTDGSASNLVADNSSATFLTGAVTPTNAPNADVLLTFAAFGNNSSASEIGVIPYGFQTIEGLAQTSMASQQWNMTAALEVLYTNTSTNPSWTISNPNTGFNDEIGVTAAFKSSVGSLVWYNVGQNATTGLSPQLGYQYYYSFVNTYTGQRSNVSPLSVSTGSQTGVAITVTGTGMQTVPSGPAATDPQVDAIEVYRNTDGQGFWYQIPPSLMTNTSGTITVNGVVYLANPGTATSAGTWSFTDVVLDTQLNTQIYAPIAFLNSPPPAGLANLTYFDGRLWGSVNNFLYYSTAADDAILLNVLQNGVGPESWEPTNYIPFDSPIVRSIVTGVGLVVFTTTDVWVVVGTNLSNYNPVKILTGIGLGNYNGVCVDGSIMMLYTRDRECLMFNVNSGASEIGFVIGDLIETTINPLQCYLARHVKGSQDNAFYFGDGATGWFRLNPNQFGASLSGEQTPIWSPFATIALDNGIKAMASIEVQPGIKLLLVSQRTGNGPVLNRDINTFSDNGTPYTWSATVGSIVLALPGKLAEIESITTEMTAATANQCGVAVLIDEITGAFESLGGTQFNPTNDPPQLPVSVSVLSNRFYLSPGTMPPLGRHMQLRFSGAATATKDEILSSTIRGALVEESQ